ncbi:MAG: hypothetical protein JJ927_15150 [Balneola sp.]|nr:hypothetical protein [Balneola sp.]MBO6652355.1 hypothetical protein [Balneola sp.]MBO6709944.1 hypothetical protein [Balneola sp.]MBO6871962.1 hypothetical protein [Balneola sp.]
MIIDWYKSHDEKEKSNFVAVSWVLIAVLGLMLIVLSIGQEHDDYFKANNGLFLMCIMTLVLILIRRKTFDQIFKNSFKLLSKKRPIELLFLSDFIFLLSVLAVLISFLFVLDLTFISENGLQIGGVVAVSMASLLNSLRKTVT